ncbi:AI-2E family transporter [Candidatus Saccharibacteria bacterium]|nr:AI-2E family transporter [Candidatus Saccharibacteria bacterium]
MSRSINVDTKTFVRFWMVIGVLLIITGLVSLAFPALLIIGIALFVAVALMPLVRKIDKKLNKKKSRMGLSAGLVVGSLAVILIFISAIIAPVVVRETSHVVSTAPEQIQKTISGWDGLNRIGDSFGIPDAKNQLINFLKDSSQAFLSSFPTTLLSSVGSVINFLVATILVVVLTILFMTQGPGILEQVLRKVNSKNEKAYGVTRKILSRFSGVISKYVVGQVSVAILDGIVTGIAVFVIALLFGLSAGLALPMAMIAMVFYLIPMFGPIITAAVVSVLLFFSVPAAGLIFLVFYIIYEQIENNVIAPRVHGNSFNLPSLIILISIILGTYMFGLIGAIVSIPIAGFIKVLIEEYPEIKTLKNSGD